jgi:hypothetical protein
VAWNLTRTVTRLEKVELPDDEGYSYRNVTAQVPYVATYWHPSRFIGLATSAPAPAPAKKKSKRGTK